MFNKTALIIGITGQDGSYLAKLLLKKGYRVFGITRDLLDYNSKNLDYLEIANEIILLELSSLDKERIVKFLNKTKPSEVYNLSSQSSVGYSFNDPFSTLNYNILSVLNWLEAIKIVDPAIRFYQASSSEMFGNVRAADLPLKESLIFHPASPYGISKAAAHWVSVNYREGYNLFASCGILFNHESCLRGPNYVVKKIINAALKIKLGSSKEPIPVGNTNIKRDWGYAPRYVEAMWKILQVDEPGDFLICSGNIMSLDGLIDEVMAQLDLDKEKYITIDKKLFRPVDLEEIYGDNTKAKNVLQWDYNLSNKELITHLIEDEKDFIAWEERTGRLK
jgi:GDPmannose 4,6-dehydratase